MKVALGPADKMRGIAKYVDVRLHKRPITVSIEVTKRCNARCDFCDYWKTTDRDEDVDVEAVVRRFDPLVVVLTGGEPMLRRDLPDIIRRVRGVPGFRYITVLTHGGFLSDEKIREVVDAGANQINVSLNYPDARQDQERGIPGLFARMERTIPKAAREGGAMITLASMLTIANMRDAEALVRLAHTWGIHIGFSGYNDLKNGNQRYFPSSAELDEFRAICRRLVLLKRELRNVASSDYFFETLPEFYARRDLPGCRAGQIMIHVSPKGLVQPCAELPAVGHFSGFVARDYPGPQCGKCFDSCRAEPEAPVTLRRIREVLGIG
jgi:MoaA/NifB/PqqE/SkfB family radical SAM enzyme